MRLLLFSDLHASQDYARNLVDRANEADILVGAGDFANARRNHHASLDILRAITKPIVMVPGNYETLEELVDACRGWESAHILHGSAITLQGISFYGLGAGVPVTPFGSWSFDLSEYEATAMLQGLPTRGVLVSHSPPKGVLDVSSSGKSLGSTAVRDAVLRCKPRLVVCGHIHRCGGRSERLGESLVVNAGPAGVCIEL
jgi:Icc-related predicted phosphoesterase